MPSIAPTDLADRLQRKHRIVLLDVRSRLEFAGGHIPGAVNLPVTEIGSRIAEVPAQANDELIVYCGHGPRAWLAAASLRRHGFRRITYLRGHWAGWRRAGFPSSHSAGV